VGELWDRSLHGSGLLGGTLDDSLAVLRWQAIQPLLERLDVEARDRKGTDATTGTTEPAGNFTEQGGRCPLKPMIGIPIKRGKAWWSGIWEPVGHGGSFPLEGKIDDEMTLG